MKKRIPQDEEQTRARKREVKKRPRMKLHGANLKRPSKYSGQAIAK